MMISKPILIIFSIALFFGLSFLIGYFRSLNTNVSRLVLTRVEDALSSLQTGDLIFTRSRNWTSLLQLYFCQTYINHVAMVYKSHTGDLWVFDVSPREGAYMIPLVDFIKYNWKGLPPVPSEAPPVGLSIPYVAPRTTDWLLTKSATYIRRLKKPLDDRATLRFLQKNLGRPYSFRWWMSAFFSSPLAVQLPIPWAFANDSPGMFCTELLAQLYAEQGFLDVRKTPASSVMPAHLWQNSIHWLQDQGLQDAEQIIGQEDLIPPFKHIDTVDAKQVWLEGARTSTLHSKALSLVDALHA